MSYVRWSTKVRDGCQDCGGTRYVPWPANYLIEREMLPKGMLCPRCTSCWYVYVDLNGGIAIHHSNQCPGHSPGDEYAYVNLDDGHAWTPPDSCPMKDVALDAVGRALADLEEERLDAAGGDKAG